MYSSDISISDFSKDRIPVGTVEFVRDFAKKIGIAIPPMPTYPEELKDFLGRSVFRATFVECPEDCFVKPVRTKVFTGGIKRNITEFVTPDTEVYFSGPLEISAEFRYYVNNGIILGSARYDDGVDEVLEPNEFVRQMVDSYRNSPIGYSLDVGMTKDGPILIEANDGWSLGYYVWGNCTKKGYVDLITDRWRQIAQGN